MKRSIAAATACIGTVLAVIAHQGLFDASTAHPDSFMVNHPVFTAVNITVVVLACWVIVVYAFRVMVFTDWQGDRRC